MCKCCARFTCPQCCTVIHIDMVSTLNCNILYTCILMYSTYNICWNLFVCLFHAGPLKACHLWQPVRRFSSICNSGPPIRSFDSFSGGLHYFPGSLPMGRRGYASLIQLEERANDEYDSPHAQARYMEVFYM